MIAVIQDQDFITGDTFQVVLSDGKVNDTIYTFTKTEEVNQEKIILCTFEVNQEGETFYQQIYFPISTSIKKCSN